MAQMRDRRLNRATLSRQLLLRREPLPVGEAVRRVVALQAQEPPSAYIALWNRLAAFDPADLDAAFAEREVVKATLMRITLHAVHAEDYPSFHNAMSPSLRGARLGDRRFLASGLSIADADALVPALLEFARQPRTAGEVEEMLATRLGEHKPRVWWALRTYAPLWHAATGGPWSFGQRTAMTAASAWLPAEHREQSLPRLIRRYLEGFGPATVADISRFSLLPRAAVREGLRGLAGELEELPGSGATQLFDVPGAPLPAEDVPAPPRLLPMWDSILLAYDDRSRVIPADYRRFVARQNGDILPTLLVDGYVAGVWRPVEGGIEATAFHVLPKQAWDGLAEEATALVAFLATREPAVYRRYARWWTDLPGAEVRVLPG